MSASTSEVEIEAEMPLIGAVTHSLHGCRATGTDSEQPQPAVARSKKVTELR